ncbi:unnamed protein product [Eruca vesicaria subsp. sativa]|uniref:Protein TIFY n=1 Tax=Eruca vesicaria subsp. sativa TaxID=29727 RepID=A0ABC8KTY3_ERUVS|nr:unnamed protein product [Eruca vesicaria subsp. sativa]
MVKVEDEPRASAEGRVGVVDGDGGEEHEPVEISGDATEHGAIAGSVAGEGGFSDERPIQEARSTEAPSSDTPTQLTIFFGGKVTVFDGLPLEKVESTTHSTFLFCLKLSETYSSHHCELFLTQIQEILGIAASAAAKSIETKNSTNVSPVLSPALNRAPSFSSTSTGASPAAQSFPVTFCRSAAELPIARRHSLQRFLEKRRDRLVNKNPYPASDVKKTDVPTDNSSIKEESPLT